MKAGTRLILACVAIVSQTCLAADLSPGKWPAEERARLERMELNPFPPKERLVEGHTALVSATLSPLAVHVGMETLRQDGTAADAAIAVALTQVSTSLGSVVSYGGVAELVYYEARTGKVYALDAGWASYAGEHNPLSIPNMDVSPIVPGRGGGKGAQGRKTLTPGFMAALETIHRRFGRLPFHVLFTPAIWYAEHGVAVSPLLAYFFQSQAPVLSRTEEGRRFLAQAGDALPKIGDRFVQPAVAHLLRGVAASGSAYMYSGPWARDFVRIVQREGGAVTLRDLAQYRPAWEQVVSTRFGGAEVFGPGEANVSGCSILEALNLLEAGGVHQKGTYWSDPQAFVLYAKDVRFAQLGHPATTAPQDNVDAQGCRARATASYAQQVAPQIDQLSATPPGHAVGHHSASVVVVDRWGNVAALVHSINAIMWGDTGIVVDGVPISGAGGLYQQRLASVPPTSHVPSDMAPMIVLREGRPTLAVATVGTSLVQETVRTVGSLLSGADPEAVAAAPPLLINVDTPFDTPLNARPEVVPSGAYGPDFLSKVEADGLAIITVPPERVGALRSHAAFAILGDGQQKTAEAPGVVVFGDAQ